MQVSFGVFLGPFLPILDPLMNLSTTVCVPDTVRKDHPQLFVFLSTRALRSMDPASLGDIEKLLDEPTGISAS